MHDRKGPENKRRRTKPKRTRSFGKRSKNRVTNAELSQVTLLSVAQPKMPPSTPATKRVIIPRSANLPNESIELIKIRTKMISL